MTGLALAGAGPRKKIGPVAYPLLAVSSLLPDSDIILRAFGAEAYQFGHLGITHSIAGLAVQAALLAFAFRSYAVNVSPAILAGLSLAGLGLHCALDCLGSWGPMLLAPWSTDRVALDWVADTDFIFILVPGLAFAMGLAREGVREAYCRAAFGILLAYICVCGTSHAMGREQARTSLGKIGIRPDRVEAFPVFLNPFRWNAVVWTPDRYYQVGVGAFGGVYGRVRSYFRVSLPSALKSGYTDQYFAWARAPVVRFTAGRYTSEAVLGDLRNIGDAVHGGYTVVITSTPSGPARRWLSREETLPVADMEFELPNQ